MSATATSYPAKVLLFGEHTVLRGGRGLAVPFPHFSLRWVKDCPDERLLKFSDYLSVAIDSHLLNTDALSEALLEDWRLEGNIPVGYGLGSSGAVCAAVWDRFATPAGKKCSGEELRNQLARMEQHFHGSSSGTDPLISYRNQPMLLGGGQPPRRVELPRGWAQHFFLVDTGITRSAAPLIREFTSRYDGEVDFAREVAAYWSAPAEECISALLSGDFAALKRAFTILSDFQVRQLPGFIPPKWRKQWPTKAAYQLKICGAGGGGMLLGLGSNFPGPKLLLG